ncbi:MAG: type VI secretion system tube protein Hcp [Bacteroidia bacterium]|nr:type VI secretion system tube protein Hcp [Bacteroidia bacterium]MBT8275376.1 type VI secretion system tube protein Hcp [Bacteroidia bacterium]NNF31958.1 hypothetical protein [Flavobacteriaceae bacterium]NNJ83048.1 hypothetical protein [Flavobacteriaceae bacterium]NNM09716.1 hypothetical protein [Flavobacteriaceae bacterium]
MKKIVILVIIGFIGFSINAQNTKLLITDLMASKQTANMNVESLSFQPDKEKNASQRNPNSTQMVYRVEKKMDGRSPKIEDASKRGRVFQKAEVWMKNHAGNLEKYKLSNAMIMNYAAHYVNGKPPKEHFTLVYQTRTKM